jgi:predicted aspartyl protease
MPGKLPAGVDSLKWYGRRGSLQLVFVPAIVFGPRGDRVVRLALDTGATATLISTAILVSLGYDPATVPERVQVTTGSGVEFVPRFAVTRLATLDQARTTFPVIAHTLPPSAPVDGLLGLDYFRQQRLIVDFRQGEITLE